MCAINPGFLKFLEALGQKRYNEPFAYWQEHIDYCTILIGTGECRNYAYGGIICCGTDILVKRHPADNEDNFAGFEIWGGIQGFLREQYRKSLGSRYGEFVLHHNNTSYKYHASELLKMILSRFPERKPDSVVRIKEALTHQDPSIHIPL